MQISGKIYYCTAAVVQVVVYNNQLKLNEVFPYSIRYDHLQKKQ